VTHDIEVGGEEDRLDAARIGGRAHFADVRLIRSAVTLDHFPNPDLELSYNLSMQPSIEYDEGHTHFVVRTSYVIEIFQTSEPDDDESTEDVADVFATLDFEYGGLFFLPPNDPPTTSELEAFARTTGTFALYPHAREYTNSTTSRMGIPPLTLDLLRIDLPTPSQSD